MMNDIGALNFSDHDLIGWNRKWSRVKTAWKTIHCRNYCWYDHKKLKDDLKTADWSLVYMSHSISDLLQAFNRILTKFFDWHAPFATISTNTKTSSRLTVDLKNETDYRDELQQKFRKSKLTENYDKYKRQRCKV